LYKQFRENPETVEASWKEFFDGFEFAQQHYPANGKAEIVPENVQKEFNVINLINGYRRAAIFSPKRIRSESGDNTHPLSIWRISGYLKKISIRPSTQAHS